MRPKLVYNLFYCLTLIVFVFSLSGCQQSSQPLPQPLYYLDGTGNTSQVWRLETNGITHKAVTKQGHGVDAFSVSPADGTLAVVSDNKLLLIKTGANSPTLIAEGSDTYDSDHPSYTSMVHSPLFSPDGKALTYGLNGIHIYDLSTGLDNHILPNPAVVNGTVQDYAKGAHSPGPWSPDGRRLLVVTTNYEGCMLSKLDPISGVQTPLHPEGAVGCQASWSEDGLYVLAANPYFTGAQPGLWRYDADTGEETFNLTLDNQNHSANFIGWPYQSADGKLLFFHALLTDLPPPEGIRLALNRISSENEDLVRILPKEFYVRDALWSPYGDKVVVVGAMDNSGRHLFYIDLESGELIVLIEDADQIRNLVWAP